MKFSAKRLVEALKSYGVKAEILSLGNTSGVDSEGNDLESDTENLSIDSRKIKQGEIFIPIKTEARDGHDFIGDAINKGASIFFASTKFASTEFPSTKFPQVSEIVQEATNATNKARTVTAILVEDPQQAFTFIAKHIRQDRLTIDKEQGRAKVIAITGSSGKTSTKDLTKAALSSTLKVHASLNSENNHLGVPLTLCNTPKGTQAIVLEVGTSNVGEIATLSEILKPDIGVVTSLGIAHIKGFKDFATIEKEKGDLLEHLPKSGHAILNANEGGSLSLANRTQANILSFGIEDESETSKIKADILGTNISLDENLNATFQVKSPFGKAEVKLNVAGKINVKNALAALAVAGVLGIDLADASQALSKASLSLLRMEIKTRPDGLLILNDTYNANPMSMKAALLELDLLSKNKKIKNKYAVLGTMHELGEMHDVAHKEVLDFAHELKIEVVAFDEPAYGVEFVDEQRLTEFLTGLGEGDVVLFKASRSVGLEKFV